MSCELPYVCLVESTFIIGFCLFVCLFLLLYIIVPSAPEHPVVSRVIGSPLNLIVTWTSPSEPNGVIESYTAYCYKPTLDLGNGTQHYSGGMRQPDVGDESMYAHTIVLGNETQATVTGLEPYTTYNCYVVGNTSAGAGNHSFADSATTDESG